MLVVCKITLHKLGYPNTKHGLHKLKIGIVHQAVQGEAKVCRKRLPADSAHAGTAHDMVLFLVLGQSRRVNESLAARVAPVGPLPRVQPQVDPHVRFVRELLAADVARKRLHPRVDPMVDP